jgi:hypothetical protein
MKDTAAGSIALTVLLLTASVWALEASTEEVVVKSTDTLVFEINANMKLTPDQQAAVRAIIMDNIVQVRALQAQVRQGDIDSKSMYTQRQALMDKENKKLKTLLNPQQMSVWLNLQQTVQ